MNQFTRQRRILLMAVAALSGIAFAQTDTARVPFIVNVAATVTAVPANGTASVVSQVQMSAAANTQTILRIPLPKTNGVLSGTQKQPNVPAVVSNGNGKITLNLPAQSYRNADVALYAVSGKRILRNNVSSSNAVNAISRRNAAPGAYLLSVKGTDGRAVTSRIMHSGGRLEISVAFNGGNLPNTPQMAKETAAGEWTVTVSAAGRVDSVFAFTPTAGTNPLKTITLREKTVTPGLSAPENVTATVTSATSITVSWSAISGVVYYEVYRSNSATGTYTWLESTSSTSYRDGGLTTGTTYYYKVSAHKGTESALSSYASAMIPLAPINPPESITASETSLSAITVSWTAVVGAVGYRVHRSTSADGSYQKIGGTTANTAATSYTNTGLPINVPYYYKVSSIESNAGEGPISSSYASATIKVISGTFIDYRDEKTYRYITVLGKKWMAENLNFETADSWCYGDSSDNCAKYGRLYAWAAATTACPSGWHLPTRDEWGALAIAAGGTGAYGGGGDGGAGTKLKSKNGWNGTDVFGFSALPGGFRVTKGTFAQVGYEGIWWTATTNGSSSAAAYARCINSGSNISECGGDKNTGNSVRCIGDN